MNYQFNEREFSGMLYNPSKVPDGKNIMLVFKELGKNRVFKRVSGEGLEEGKVMLYIVCMYDKNSPYRKKYPDVLKRKIEVAHDVGFEMEHGGKFVSPVEDLLRGKNEIVNSKVTEFVRLHRNFQYSYLVATEAGYYSIIADIVGGDVKRIADARNAKDDLEKTLMDMLAGDQNPAVVDSVLRYMEEERLNLRPEDIAQKLAKNEPPVTIEEIQ
jgi:hypothetical protein